MAGTSLMNDAFAARGAGGLSDRGRARRLYRRTGVGEMHEGEHGGEHGEEESGNTLALDQTYDKVRNVEDEPRIAHWLKVHFERAGFHAEVAGDGRTGLARSHRPHLIVLDLMLPRLDGMQVCRTLRRESAVPIIMLTARETHADRIAGLDGGADDYVVKPFDPDEVVARAKAVLRRVDDRVPQVLQCGAFTIDDTTRQVTVDERPISLSRAQFALLSAFVRHPNPVLTREQLITLAFSDDFDAYDRAIDNHVLRLRKLIGRDGKQPIQTVYSLGYRFVAERS